ncbi:MAG: hypothetical protein JWP65_1718 [Ramlibacter sp.]|jgi:hypothetical protein|uniref:hypothetical protein n=1 Tax=Ramlibacter sp. TaxID=1917967 RepID=UPI00261D8703|nr:hypothetical protein [Ramlibacter sp.]MDB5751297.1 hypothetical protein [Ramlibacter sp.]
MQTITRLTILSAIALLAGCASQPPAGPPGKHLVYRDSNGAATRQFDYPDIAFCQRVEALAGRSARCQAEAASGLAAKATLRYNPPGILVEGHYSDLGRCRSDTGGLPAGVQLINPCTAK